MIDMWGGRKFVGFLFITTLLAVLVLYGKVTPDVFVQFVTVNFGIYVGGNIADKLT